MTWKFNKAGLQFAFSSSWDLMKSNIWNRFSWTTIYFSQVPYSKMSFRWIVLVLLPGEKEFPPQTRNCTRQCPIVLFSFFLMQQYAVRKLVNRCSWFSLKYRFILYWIYQFWNSKSTFWSDTSLRDIEFRQRVVLSTFSSDTSVYWVTTK